jgi:hypothetical protein
MSTDVNDFDKYLKERLHRDLLFRALIWLGISLGTAYLAIHDGGSTPIAYLERVSNSLSPLINTIGAFGLMICLLALLLKDLEAVSTNEETKARTRGHLAGFVRRLAGDVTLWTMGALLAMISALTVVCFSSPMSNRDVIAARGLFFLLAGITAFTGAGNILVRRSAPTPLAQDVKKPAILVLVYLGALAVVIFALLRKSL